MGPDQAAPVSLDLAGFQALIAQPLLLQGPLQVLIDQRQGRTRRCWLPGVVSVVHHHDCDLGRPPLHPQAVLELLFGTLKSQAAAIGELQGQVAGLDGQAAALAAAGADADERGQGAAAALRQLQSRLEAHEAAAARERREASTRLEALERRLHGASNVAGRQAALDDIASMLGVAVPEPAVPLAPQADPAACAVAAPSPPPPASAHVSADALAEPDSFAHPTNGRRSQSGGAAVDAEGTAGRGAPAEGSYVAVEAGAGTEADSEGDSAAAADPEGTDRQAGWEEEAPEAADEAAAEHCIVWVGAATDGMGGERPSTGGRRSMQRASSLGQPAAAAAAPCPAAEQPCQGSLPPSGPGVPVAGPGMKTAQPGSRRTTLAAAASTRARTSGGSGRPSGTGSAAAGQAAAPAAEPPLPQARSHMALPTEHSAEAEGSSRQVPTHSPLPSLSSPSSRPAPTAAAAARPEAPSPAALLAAVQAGRAKPATAGQAPPSPASSPTRRLSQLGRSQQGRPRAASLPLGPASAAAGAAEPAGQAPAAAAGQEEGLGGFGASAAEGASEASLAPPFGGSAPVTGRRKTEASRKLLEVVALLRKRPSIQETGLLWQLQASLHETAEEQERLKGEVRALQEQLQEQLACSARQLDAVQPPAAGGGSLPAAPAPSGASIEEFKVLEDRVDVLGCEAQQGAQRLVRLEGQVQESSKRLARLEDAAEAGQAAASLARASSSGTAGDALAALQGHLLAQQQKLQAHADSLAAGIRQGLAGQVHNAVTGAVGEVGRRLSERLATRQDLQALSYKVTGKVSREEVERMLRAHRAAAAAAAQTAVDPAWAGPAAGMKFKCISCDADLQPFLFAAAAGALGGGGQNGGTADLRYCQLPAASPPRNPGQPWTAAVAGAAGPGARPDSAAPLSGGSGGDSCGQAGTHVQPPAPQQSGVLSSRPSTGASRLGAPVSWMHRMRRDTGGSSHDAPAGAAAAALAATPPAGSRRESVNSAAELQQQPSLTSVALRRPQTASPVGGGTPRQPQPQPQPQPQQQQQQQQQPQQEGEQAEGSDDFYTSIREEPAGAEAAAAEEPSRASLASSASSCGGGGKGGALPALASPPGCIKAARPATAALPAAGDWELARLGNKRKTTGAAGGLVH